MLLSPERYAQRRMNVSVREQSGESDNAHRRRFWRRAVNRMPKSASEDPQAECTHSNAFEQGGAGSMVQRQAGDRKTDPLFCGVPEELERVRLE
jgi:hypothetical protein